MAGSKKATKGAQTSHPGPKSALEGGPGSRAAAEADKGKGMVYSVQCHDDEHGLRVRYYKAENGDDAARKALADADYKGTSIRGVTPATDPDANSMGGERDAAIMIANADNGGIVDTLGTEANAEASRELGKADIQELGE